MMSIFLTGLIAGCAAYTGKWIIFMIGTHPRWTRWIRNIFHSGPVGLFVLDAVSGFVILHMIAATGAKGLTTLFVLIGFTACSVTYILLHLGIHKAAKTVKGWCSL